MEAINRLENALVAKLENHLDLEADEIPDSDEEVFYGLKTFILKKSLFPTNKLFSSQLLKKLISTLWAGCGLI